MTKNIEVVPQLDELAKLKAEVLKQVPKAEKPQDMKAIKSSQEIKNNINELAKLKDAILHSRELQAQKPKEAETKENLAINESPEKHNEKIPTSRNKVVSVKAENVVREDLHFPPDASVASNINRIKDYNNIARATQEISKFPLLGWVRDDEIPENLA